MKCVSFVAMQAASKPAHGGRAKTSSVALSQNRVEFDRALAFGASRGSDGCTTGCRVMSENEGKGGPV